GSVLGDSVIVGHGATAANMTIEYAVATKHPAPSVPRMVNGNVPAAVGVPASTPAADSVRPAGSGPVVVNVYGVVPPDAEIVCVGSTPTRPLSSAAGSIAIVGQTAGAPKRVPVAGTVSVSSVPARRRASARPVKPAPRA